MAQRLGRGIALLFHDRGTRRGWVVSSMPRPYFTPGKDLVTIVQEVGWAPGLVWTDRKSCPTGIWSLDHPAHSQSLYQLSYPAYINWSTWRETCASIILYTTYLLRTSLGLNPGLHSEWLVTAEALLPCNGHVHVNNSGCVRTGWMNEQSDTSHILSAIMSSDSSSVCLMYQQKSIMYTFNNKHLNLDTVDVYLHS